MDAWLRCQVSAGQFTTEAAIRGTDFKNEEFSLFVPIRDVQPNDVLGDEWINGAVRVELLDSRDAFHLVYLPNPTMGNGQTITVRGEQLESGQPTAS